MIPSDGLKPYFKTWAGQAQHSFAMCHVILLTVCLQFVQRIYRGGGMLQVCSLKSFEDTVEHEQSGKG